MSAPLIILPAARDDLWEAQSWYEQKQLGLGDRFVAEVERVLLALPNRRLSMVVSVARYDEQRLEHFPTLSTTVPNPTASK